MDLKFDFPEILCTSLEETNRKYTETFCELLEAKQIILALKKQLKRNGLKPEYDGFDAEDTFKAMELKLEDILDDVLDDILEGE